MSKKINSKFEQKKTFKLFFAPKNINPSGLTFPSVPPPKNWLWESKVTLISAEKKKACRCISQKVYLEPKWLRWLLGLEHSIAAAFKPISKKKIFLARGIWIASGMHLQIWNQILILERPFSIAGFSNFSVKLTVANRREIPEIVTDWQVENSTLGTLGLRSLDSQKQRVGKVTSGRTFVGLFDFQKQRRTNHRNTG